MSRGPPGSGLQERPPSAASTCESARPRRPRAGRPTASRPTCATPSASRACWPRGELSFARVPTVEEERFRDLVRAREDLRRDLMRARHRLSKLLLRREIRYPGKGRAWTRTHMDWLRSFGFEDEPSASVFCDYLAAVELLLQRRSTLNETIERLWPQSPPAETI